MRRNSIDCSQAGTPTTSRFCGRSLPKLHRQSESARDPILLKLPLDSGLHLIARDGIPTYDAIVYSYLLLGSLFQIGAASASVPLLNDCSDSARVVARLTPASAIQVRFSLAGNSQTCYSVVAVVDGREVAGHVLGQSLPAIAEFERQLSKSPAVAPAPAPPSEAVPAVPQAAPKLPLFGDFNAVDVYDRSVALSGLKGKVTLICFWSPGNPKAGREVLDVNRLTGQWRARGLSAVVVSLDQQREKVLDALEDLQVTLPVIADRYGLAQRRRISAADLPYTLVLNDRLEIVSSGLHGRELETTVDGLLNQR